MNNSILQLISLRIEADKLQRQITKTNDDALFEAIDLLSNNTGSQIVFENVDAKVIVVFRKKYATPETDVKLERLDCDINNELTRLTNEKIEQLKELDKVVESLENELELLKERRNKLLSNKYLINLKMQYSEYREASQTLQPNLSITLKTKRL